MRNLKLIFNTLWALTLVVAVSFLIGCGNEDDGPVEFEIVELMAGDSDLNAATSPSDVATDAAITATFSTDVDATSADETSIMLMREYDDAEIPIVVSTSGNTVTVTPQEALGGGTLYILTISGEIASTDGQPLGSDVERNFTTEGTFTPAGVIAHWTFEGNAEDVVGDYDASEEVAVTYTDSRNEAAGQAATFDGDASIIEVPGGDELMDTENFSLSFWFKTNSEGHVNAEGNPTGHFVLGLGAFYGFQFEVGGNYDFVKMPAMMEFEDGTTGTGGDLFWNGDGKTKDNEGWQGTVFNDVRDVAALVKDQWTHVVYVFNGADKTRSMYVNGELRIQQDLNLWPEDAKERTAVGLMFGGAEPEVEPVLAFGFVQSRGGTLWDNEPWGGYDFATSQHFKGQLDDVKIFHQALTEQEVDLMYESEN